MEIEKSEVSEVTKQLTDQQFLTLEARLVRLERLLVLDHDVVQPTKSGRAEAPENIGLRVRSMRGIVAGDTGNSGDTSELSSTGSGSSSTIILGPVLVMVVNNDIVNLL